MHFVKISSPLPAVDAQAASESTSIPQSLPSTILQPTQLPHTCIQLRTSGGSSEAGGDKRASCIWLAESRV